MDKSPKPSNNDKLEAYYRIPTAADNDFCVTDCPIIINCTGYSEYNCNVCGNSLRKDYYCIYLTHGKIEVKYPFKYTMHAGDMVIFSPDTPYEYTGLKPFKYHWIHFTGNGAEQFLSGCKIEMNKAIHVGLSESLLITLQNIKNRFKCRDLYWETTAAAELLNFFAKTGKEIGSILENKSHISEMEKIAVYIQSNINNNLSVEKIAKLNHMSTSSFRSKFKEYSGMSPQEYINTVRLSEAARLLISTDTSIESIASICGYSDAMYFSRIFHKKTGQSPREYRKRHLKAQKSTAEA